MLHFSQPSPLFGYFSTLLICFPGSSRQNTVFVILEGAECFRSVKGLEKMSSPSGLKPESHFKIHVAKAKDLPLSWYDLVLRPEKFAEHLETLREDPEGKSL